MGIFPTSFWLSLFSMFFFLPRFFPFSFQQARRGVHHQVKIMHSLRCTDRHAGRFVRQSNQVYAYAHPTGTSGTSGASNTQYLLPRQAKSFWRRATPDPSRDFSVPAFSWLSGTDAGDQPQSRDLGNRSLRQRSNPSVPARPRRRGVKAQCPRNTCRKPPAVRPRLRSRVLLRRSQPAT